MTLNAIAFCLLKQYMSSLKNNFVFSFCRLAVSFKKDLQPIIFVSESIQCWHIVTLKPGFHYMVNATTTTQKQSDYKVEQSSFTLVTLF